MATTFDTISPRSARTGRGVIAGRILSGIAILALTADAAGKLFAPAVMIANTPPLGIPADAGLYRLIGAILAACVALYAWPRTALIGAVLTTGFLGGAVAINLRAGMPLFSNTLFGVYLGLVVWGGLYPRNPALRALVRGGASPN